MNLNEALRQFDLVEANLSKLDAVWSKMSALIPEGITFIGNSPTGREYRNLERDFLTILANIPAIDGWRIESCPPDLDDLARDRLDAFLPPTARSPSQPTQPPSAHRPHWWSRLLARVWGSRSHGAGVYRRRSPR